MRYTRIAVWRVVFLEPVVSWDEGLLQDDAGTAGHATAARDLLEETGPSFGSPMRRRASARWRYGSRMCGLAA